MQLPSPPFVPVATQSSRRGAGTLGGALAGGCFVGVGVAVGDLVDLHVRPGERDRKALGGGAKTSMIAVTYFSLISSSLVDGQTWV